MTGALATGDKVVVDVGRDFTLTSQQDQNHYDSKQTNQYLGIGQLQLWQWQWREPESQPADL